MKRNKLIFVTLLVVAGCSAADQYSLEREYWKLGKLSERIAENPDATPWPEAERVARMFADFSERHPGTNLAASSDFSVARIYMMKHDPERARKQLEAVAGKYVSPDIKAEAYFMIGTTWQESDWPKALENFAKVTDEFPTTNRGMGMPLYIAEYYRDHFQPDKMNEAYNDAIRHYGAIADKFPGSPVAFRAGVMISSCYGGLKDWRNAVRTLEELVPEFGSKVRMDGVLMSIALIYRNELGDADRYRDTLDRLVREYPGGQLEKTAKALLKSPDNDDGKRGAGK